MGIYFKNPPGRLLRRQWSYPIKVFPEYQVWRNFVKHADKEQLQFDINQLIDVDSSKVGLVRTNSKYCFPCDNSVIRIDKHVIGNRRFGSSLVVKDNFAFGIKENIEKFKNKAGFFEDEILSREAFAQADKRCTFWLEFENGVKLLVEMQDKQIAHLEEIPLHEPLPFSMEEDKMAMTHQSMMHGGDEPDGAPAIQDAAAQNKVVGGLNKNES